MLMVITAGVLLGWRDLGVCHRDSDGPDTPSMGSSVFSNCQILDYKDLAV